MRLAPFSSVFLVAFVAQAFAQPVRVIPDPEGGVVRVDLQFPKPEVSSAGVRGLEIQMSGFQRTVDAGQPALPFETLRIALPVGTTSARIRLENIQSTTQEGELALVNPMRAIGAGTGSNSGMPKVAARPSVEVSLQHLHGVPVAIVRMIPVQVGSHSFSVTERATLVLETSAAAGLRAARVSEDQLEDLRNLVDNPQALPLPTLNFTAADDYETLVVTGATLAAYQGENSLATIQAHWAERGLRSKVVLVSDIAKSTTGADLQEKIRNYIAQEYQAHHIRYVLLAGDGDRQGSGAVIPARKLWSKIMAYDGTWKEVSLDIPADIYYSCLDGSFNENGNTRWGELNDGPEGGDVDLLPEVTVGRAPLDTVEDLKNFVRKTVQFSTRTWERKTLLLGEVLFADKNIYGDDYLKQLVGSITDHGYSTQGYGPEWTIDALADRQRTWSGSDALKMINAGHYAMVNHLGHSNTTYNMRMNSGSSFPAFRNPEPFFYYTQGCYPGDFTASDSFVEKFLRHPNGMAAGVANTVYGLSPEDPDPSQTQTPGASQMLHRQFVNSIFGNGVRVMGMAHQNSKLAFLGYRSTQEMRWVFWGANYFGDPSLTMNLIGD